MPTGERAGQLGLQPVVRSPADYLRAPKLRSFAERHGFAPSAVLQTTSLDDAARVAICNEIAEIAELLEPPPPRYGISSDACELRGEVARDLLGRVFSHYRVDIPIVSFSAWSKLFERLRSASWPLIMDALERLAAIDGPLVRTSDENGRLDASLAIQQRFDQALERANVGYRFAAGELVALTSELELEAVSSALDAAAGTGTIDEHLRSAVRMLRAPVLDYRNSIKESISAVEAAVQYLTGDMNATLGKGLKALESSGVEIHGSLQRGWGALYGWTSDGDGIRHALMDEPKLEQRDALYMLVSCSAFVSYLLSAKRQQ